MQTICMSLLKTIQEYDEAINEVMAPQSQGTQISKPQNMDIGG